MDGPGGGLGGRKSASDGAPSSDSPRPEEALRRAHAACSSLHAIRPACLLVRRSINELARRWTGATSHAKALRGLHAAKRNTSTWAAPTEEAGRAMAAAATSPASLGAVAAPPAVRSTIKSLLAAEADGVDGAVAGAAEMAAETGAAAAGAAEMAAETGAAAAGAASVTLAALQAPPRWLSLAAPHTRWSPCCAACPWTALLQARRRRQWAA